MRSLLALALSIAFVSPVLAQMKSVVEFAPGNFGAMVSGTVIGDEYMDYMLGAKGGQSMFVELTVEDSNGDGTVFFDILPPGFA